MFTGLKIPKLIRSVLSIGVIFSALNGCESAAPKGNSGPSDKIQKIIISADQVYDLSGYGNGDNGRPYNLFDENAYVDPRYDRSLDEFIPVTNCQPLDHQAIYFHKREGNRIVTDLRIPYSLKEIYLYDRSLVSDTVQVYTGSLKKWKEVSSFTTVSETGRWGWKKISLNDKTQFVMIRFSSYQSAISEMVLYGTPLEAIPPPASYALHKGFTKTPLNLFLGVNYIMESEPRFIKPFHYSRIYNVAFDFDNDTCQDENKVRFNMLHYGFYSPSRKQYIFDIDSLKEANDGNIWFSLSGASANMSAPAASGTGRATNHPLMNTEDPASYSRHAAMMWNMAAFFGYHKVDTNLLSISNEPKESGRGSMSIWENGNEEDATWVGNKYCSPYEYYVQSSADWDGDECRLGKKFGIHDADPKARLMTSGLIGLDTNRIRLYRFLSQNLRNDKLFIWQAGIQYHYYAQKSGKGISPEQDSMRLKLSKVADFTYRLEPGVKCFLGENGYDKSPVSRQSTPMIPGRSASQSQGIMILRSINATFFSGFDAYILYWLRDGVPETDPRVYLTSGLLWKMPNGQTKVYPGWYYISTLVNRLGKYRPDSIISEKGDVWIYKYRNCESPDSVAYFAYKPTVNGSSIPTYSFETGETADGQVQKIVFTDESEWGRAEFIPVRNSKTMITIDEKPTLVLCKESHSAAKL